MHLHLRSCCAGVPVDTYRQVYVIRSIGCGAGKKKTSPRAVGQVSESHKTPNSCASTALSRCACMHPAHMLMECKISCLRQALRRATWMPKVPAHRVISASGDIGGFGGTAGLSTAPVQRKRALLEEEGLEFHGSQLVSTDALLGPEEMIELS